MSDPSSDTIVLNLFAATLSPPPVNSPSPESRLTAIELKSGFLPSVFRIATTTPVSNPVSLVAAIYLKNLIRREWQHTVPPTANQKIPKFHSSLPEQDRAFVRDNIVPAMAAVDPKIRAQLAEALKRIVSADFPLRFPQLMPVIVSALHANHVQSVEAGLIALRGLAKVYEFKGASLASRLVEGDALLAADPRGPDAPVDLQFLHDHPRAGLNFIVDKTFPTMLHIMRVLERTIDSRTQATSGDGHVQVEGLSGDKPFDMQKFICKIFWSVTQYDLPKLMADDMEGAFSDWMTVLLTAMRRPVTPPACAHGARFVEDDFRRMPQWKVKQWAGHIVYRLFQRYSNPTRLNQSLRRILDVDLMIKFGDFFRRKFAAPFTTAMLDVLCTDRRYTSPRVANLALLYVESAVSPGITYRVIKPRLAQLVTEIIFPYLCISDGDLSLWEEDPTEYVRKTYDVLEDFNTPRAAACSLLYILSKLRRSVVVAPLLAFLTQILDRYAESEQQLEHGAYVDLQSQEAHRIMTTQKDGALLAIGTIRETLLAGDPEANYLRALLSTYVIEEFESRVPFLRARACWLYGQLAASRSVPIDVVLPGLKGVQKCLGDTEFPVRVRAAVDIRHFLQNRVAAERVAINLGDLLTLLFTLLDDIDNTDIVATIDQVVVGFSDEVAPFARPLCERLVTTFTRAVSAGQCDDEAGYAAAQCLQAMESIVTAVAQSGVSNKLQLFAEMEQIIADVFENMFEEERIEHFEQSLELLALFVYHSAEERGAYIRACQEAAVEPQESLICPTYTSGSQSAAVELKLCPQLRQAMQDDIMSGGGVISPYLWSMFPRAMHAFHEWASDYSYHYLHVVDSYLSKSPRMFFSPRKCEAPYVQLLLGMISRLWDDSSLEEDDFAVQGSRVCGLLLQHCRNIEGSSVEREVGVLTELVVLRLRANSRSSRAVSSLIVSLAHLTYVSPMTTIAVIDKSLGCTEEVFSLWMSMVHQDNLERDYDRKASAIALSAILGSDWNQLPTVLRQSIPQILITVVQLLESLAKSAEKRRRRIVVESDSRYRTYPGSGMGVYGDEISSSSDVDAVSSAEIPVAEDVGRQLAQRSMDINEMESFPSNGDMDETRDEEDDASEDADYRDVGTDEFGEWYDDAEVGENSMFCILQEIDELLYFDSVVSKLSPMASQQLTKALASEETQRIQGALHRAAELRTVLVNGVAKV